MLVEVSLLILFIICVLIAIFTKEEQPEEEIIENVDCTITDIIEEKPNILTETYLILDNYIGQVEGVEYIKGHIKRSKDLDKALPHILLWGPGGLGKSTLVKAIAYEMGGKFIEIVPANLRSLADLFSIFFTKECTECGRLNPFSVNKCLYCKESIKNFFYPNVQLNDKDIILLEECHGLKVDIEEAMYSLLQDSYMMMRYNGQDQQIKFPDITVAGATTDLGSLKQPFRTRFKITVQLKPYTIGNISKITKMYCDFKEIDITEEAIKRIAAISYGTPRIAKKYVDDSITIGSPITEKEINKILELTFVDNYGLSELHRKALKYMWDRTKGKPNAGAGAKAIASTIGLKETVYGEIIEPGLLYKELIMHGPRGRMLTEKAIKLFFEKRKGN